MDTNPTQAKAIKARHVVPAAALVAALYPMYPYMWPAPDAAPRDLGWAAPLTVLAGIALLMLVIIGTAAVMSDLEEPNSPDAKAPVGRT